MKKYLKSVLAIPVFTTILASTIGNVYAEEVQDPNPKTLTLADANITEKVVSSWNIGGKENRSRIVEGPKPGEYEYFWHNDGLPMETDMIGSEVPIESPVDDEGNTIESEPVSGQQTYLIGLHGVTLNGQNYEKYYFSDSYENEISEVETQVIADSMAIKEDPVAYQTSIQGSPEEGAMLMAAESPIYRTFHFTFKDALTGWRDSELSTTVSFKRMTKTADINGTTSSVWDVKTFTENDFMNGYLPYYQYTRLDVNYSSQKLLSYGPLDDGGGNVSVSLAAPYAASVSWSMDSGVYSTDCISSTPNKYGRWKWSKFPYALTGELVTQPGIRVSNSVGNLGIKISHSQDFHNTGIITYYIPDR